MTKDKEEINKLLKRNKSYIEIFRACYEKRISLPDFEYAAMALHLKQMEEIIKSKVKL